MFWQIIPPRHPPSQSQFAANAGPRMSRAWPMPWYESSPELHGVSLEPEATSFGSPRPILFPSLPGSPEHSPR